MWTLLVGLQGTLPYWMPSNFHPTDKMPMRQYKSLSPSLSLSLSFWEQYKLSLSGKRPQQEKQSEAAELPPARASETTTTTPRNTMLPMARLLSVTALVLLGVATADAVFSSIRGDRAREAPPPPRPGRAALRTDLISQLAWCTYITKLGGFVSLFI